MPGVIRSAIPYLWMSNSRLLRGFVGIALAVLLIQPSLAIDINPENQVGPTIERWSWDLKGSRGHTDTPQEAQLLYGDVQANLVRIPVESIWHNSDGTLDPSHQYGQILESIHNIQAVNPDVEVFASIRLRGATTFFGPTTDPGWLIQGTQAWPVEQGQIFSNTVDKPNPEFYSQLWADAIDFFADNGVNIDYIGLNNKSELALDAARYVDSVDQLNAELTNRGYDTADFQYVGAEAFGPNGTINFLQDINSLGRLDTIDVVGSHQYYFQSNHQGELWQTIAEQAPGRELWHTEVHLNPSNNGNGDLPENNIGRMRGYLGVLFSANLNGASSFNWWQGGTNLNEIDDWIKREVINSTIHGHPVESPTFDEQEFDPNSQASQINQAFRQGDLLTLWIARPEFSEETDFPVNLVEGIIATEGSLGVTGEYVQGAGNFGNSLTADSMGNLSFVIDGDQRGFSIDQIPQNSIAMVQFVLAGRLVWNQGSGNFDEGFARSNGFGEVGATNVDPFGHAGIEALYIGNGGLVALDSTTNLGGGAVKSLVVGTGAASDIIENRNGFGVLTVSDAVSLTVGDGTPVSNGVGDFIVGDGGQQALVNWNSSGTLDIQGRFRIGQEGGAGQFTQTDGVVTAGSSGGSSKFISVGAGAGGLGIYNLNQGTFLPGGGLTGLFRELRIGSATTGEFFVGDGSGDANSANVQTRWQIFVGHNGGDGSLTINTDGTITQVGSSSSLTIGNGSGQGTVTQLGGSVTGEHLLRIGVGSGSVGSYAISGGLLDIANIGSGEIRVGENGATGTLTIAGAATVSAGADLVIADTDDAGTVGLLEILGSDVSISVGKLGNATGNDETLRWVADATGVSPLTVRGDGGSSLYVELQSPDEIALNLDGSGDGIALDLDLSLLSALDTQLTLIDNLSMEPIQGFFENPLVAGDLFEEGDMIDGTGFDGIVTISYTGGTGNDVVLNLLTEGISESADFDSDLDVDGIDFLTWQRGLGSAGGLSQGDADGNGLIDQADFVLWQNQYATSAPLGAATAIPEPSSMAIALVFTAMIGGCRQLPVSQ